MKNAMKIRPPLSLPSWIRTAADDSEIKMTELAKYLGVTSAGFSEACLKGRLPIKLELHSKNRRPAYYCKALDVKQWHAAYWADQKRQAANEADKEAVEQLERELTPKPEKPTYLAMQIGEERIIRTGQSAEVTLRVHSNSVVNVKFAEIVVGGEATRAVIVKRKS